MGSKSTHRHSRINHPPISFQGHAANMYLDTHNIVIFFQQTSLGTESYAASNLGRHAYLIKRVAVVHIKESYFFIFALLVLVKYDMMTPNALVLPGTK